MRKGVKKDTMEMTSVSDESSKTSRFLTTHAITIIQIFTFGYRYLYLINLKAHVVKKRDAWYACYNIYRDEAERIGSRSLSCSCPRDRRVRLSYKDTFQEGLKERPYA